MRYGLIVDMDPWAHGQGEAAIDVDLFTAEELRLARPCVSGIPRGKQCMVGPNSTGVALRAPCFLVLDNC